MEEPISLSDTEDFTLQETSSKENQDYLIMTIELGDGQQQHIKIHSSDDPGQLAHDFIKFHNLNPDLEQSLSSLIKQNLNLLDKRSPPSPFMKSSLSNFHSLTKEDFFEKGFNSHSLFKHTPQVNKKSLMIASKQSRNGDIYERLYRLSLKKKVKKNEISAHSSPEKICFFNPGESLYIKGIAMQRAKLKFVDEKNKEKAANELKNATFKPCINQFERKNDQRPEEILLEKAKNYEIHKKELKEKFEKEELKNCPFKPNSLKLKEKINKNVHEDLFKEAQKRHEKQVQVASLRIFPFEPNANKPKNNKKSEKREEFIERLLNSKKKMYEEMEKLRNLQNSTYDSVTGQEFFKPITLSSSEANLRRSGKSIWDYLYEMKDSKKEKIKQIMQNEEMFWAETSKQVKIGNKSEKVYQKFQEKQYKKLFEVLDSDKDGVISADSIDLQSVPEKTLEVLSPLLEHLLNTGSEINYTQFTQYVEELKNHLDLHNRTYLLKRDEKIETYEMNPYPQLSKMTLEIAERNKNQEGIYERQVKSKLVSQLKLEKRKELEQEKIVSECRFNPTLIANSKF